MDLTTLISPEFLALALGIYAVIVAVANLITMLVPSVKENKFYNFVMKVLNFLALNVLKNKNADEVNVKKT